jgi:hypothetical protein
MTGVIVDIKDYIMFESHRRLARQNVQSVPVRNLEILIAEMTIKFKSSSILRN